MRLDLVLSREARPGQAAQSARQPLAEGRGLAYAVPHGIVDSVDINDAKPGARPPCGIGLGELV